MKIYPQEIEDGISEGLAKASTFEIPIRHDFFSKASLDNNLYPIKSVLVSTGWNKNDDVFDKYEVWKSRKSAVNQKIDFEHDELTIIGHITSAFAFSDDGPISDDIPFDDIPDKYHILTEGYLYTYWQSEARQLLINQIIAEIPDDKWFVSMECVFDDFDYAVKKDGKSWVLRRNETTAFLSKHLRIYKGTGEYEGYKVGRLLRDFSFSGKGIVSRPANPDSVILDPEDFESTEINFVDFANSSVCKVNEENDMSDVNVELVEAKNRIKELESALANKDIEKHVAIATELGDTVKSLESQLATASCEKDTLAEKLSATEIALQSLQAELAEAKKQSEAATKEKEEMAKKAKCSQRAMKLVEAGISEEEANDKANKFIDVAEEIFDEYVVAVKKGKDKPEDKKETEATVTEVVEATEVIEEPIPTDNGQDESIMLSIAKFIEVERSKNKKSKESK